ncbi:hypothetical protein HNY73_014671 [Argiope bruennichi]|uniref:Uncharacterized protein n=1 Tax=Argiope bruennichi TaxID=94029 RepID=A0A8T0EQ31_ARGBR|nr:hypothetical protein HNY73_014671 [Argiope bruennichi]
MSQAAAAQEDQEATVRYGQFKVQVAYGQAPRIGRSGGAGRKQLLSSIEESRHQAGPGGGLRKDYGSTRLQVALWLYRRESDRSGTRGARARSSLLQLRQWVIGPGPLVMCGDGMEDTPRKSDSGLLVHGCMLASSIRLDRGGGGRNRRFTVHKVQVAMVNWSGWKREECGSRSRRCAAASSGERLRRLPDMRGQGVFVMEQGGADASRKQHQEDQSIGVTGAELWVEQRRFRSRLRYSVERGTAAAQQISEDQAVRKSYGQQGEGGYGPNGGNRRSDQEGQGSTAAC